MGFFKTLLTLARQVEGDSWAKEDLPWAGFTSQELQSIENCIADQKVETDDYLIALTLLPRLIALVDPHITNSAVFIDRSKAGS